MGMGAASVDLLSKWLAVAVLGRSKITQGHGIYWSLAYDPGDSIYPHRAGVFQVVSIHFVLIGLLCAGVVATRNTWGRIGAGLAIGGTVGNWLDLSVGNKTVVDFIAVGNWKVFNLADFSVIIGVILIGIGLIMRRVNLKRAKAGSVHESGEVEQDETELSILGVA